jgi:hypothetical protein
MYSDHKTRPGMPSVSYLSPYGGKWGSNQLESEE